MIGVSAKKVGQGIEVFRFAFPAEDLEVDLTRIFFVRLEMCFTGYLGTHIGVQDLSRRSWLSQATNERDTKIKVRQMELRLEKSRVEVKDDVISKAEAIKVGYISYQKARTARQESEKYYQSILANLRMGKISSAVVKNALDAYNDSRQREVEALVGYNISLMQFDLATNILLEKYNVDVNRYLAESK